MGAENLPQFNQLRKELSYEDKRATYNYLKWRKIQKKDDLYLQNGCRGRRDWFVDKFGREVLDEKVKEFAALRYGTCLKFENGQYWTYSGLQKLVSETLGINTVQENRIQPSSWKNIPWVTKPHEPRWYQSKAVDLLAPLDGSRTHGAVSVGTGLGKSLIMALIAKRIGLEAIVVVPTLSIANQMLKDFSNWFGAGKVGQFFDGKKQFDRHIVIAVAKSLMNVEKEDEKTWGSLANRKLLLCDESHTCPPDSLATVMFSLLADIPYRYFFSGTQFRGDGLGTLLQGITHDVVFEMSVREGIEQEFLSPLKFFMWRIKSDAKLRTSDIIKMNKVHLQQNKAVYKHAAALINRAVKEKNRRVLVLVDGVGQFKRLLDGGLEVPAKFAHGGVTKDNKKEVPEVFWKSDPMALVESFDKGEFPVLVGTSCIGMGTDLKSVDFVVSIIGLTSEIEVTQNIGRGTRLFPGKIDCHYHDYWVTNIEETDRHALKRIKIFNGIYGECRVF